MSALFHNDFDRLLRERMQSHGGVDVKRVKASKDFIRKSEMERNRNRGARFRNSHKEYIKEYRRKYRETHKEYIKEYRRKYLEAHKEETKAYQREWYLKNREKILAKIKAKRDMKNAED